MPNRFTETTSTGWGKNIGDSIKGVLFGVLLFLASFVVLWTNEGRQDMSEAAKDCEPISAEKSAPDMEGKPVAVTAKLVSEQMLGDPGFLKPGAYLTLSRHVEMFAWVEETSSRSEKKLGGGTETVTEYNYVEKWTSSPTATGNFKHPEGHENPVLTLENKSFSTDVAKIGIYSVDLSRLSLPGESPLNLTGGVLEFAVPEQQQGFSQAATQGSGFTLSQDNSGTTTANNDWWGNQGSTTAAAGNMRLEGNYIYIGNGSIQQPQLGDIRISYTMLENDIRVTIFGQLSGSSIVPFMYEGEHRLFRAFRSEREEAIAAMHTEYKTVGWLLRIVGFMMMWIGLTMFFGPINAILDVVPFLGKVGRGIVSFVMFIPALILSVLTVLVSMIFHNTIILIITLVVVAGITAFLIMRGKQESA
ncbi:MAG: TMEM43 family protein [Acidobacteria bacterium]|nr:TMEM43 family protein [Acidobacteriota bacterium]